MTSAARHNELVDFIMNESEEFETGKELEAAFVERFGDFTFADLDKAMADAADRIREREAELNAEADALAEFLPLFHDEPEGALIGEIATRKAAAGDPLAIRFLSTLHDEDQP